MITIKDYIVIFKYKNAYLGTHNIVYSKHLHI